ncbi:MAG TPA: redoxin domain-containing protein [Terriglobales bacterium]|nr:redoxin domain-containing protein [Terriglobales bacterium]
MCAMKNSDKPMLQAEVGGRGRVDTCEGLQRPGYMVHDFSLPTISGNRIRISDYRGRASLVLFFLGNSSKDNGFLKELAGRKNELTEQEAIVIAIAPHMPGIELQKMAAKFVLVLVDEDTKIHRQFGAVDQQGQPASVIYITDKFGEVVSVHSELNHKQLPNISEIVKTLEFISHQCPECEPSEWPR